MSLRNFLLRACTAVLVIGLRVYGSAGTFETGEHDEEAVRILRKMSEALPLRTTVLKSIAPDFAVVKKVGLGWSEAVAEANLRHGQRQPQRAAFLRKYLTKGSSETQLAELGLDTSGISMRTGSGVSRGFVFGPTHNPTSTITVWVAQGRLINEPTLSIAKGSVGGVAYSSLLFDVQDRLISVNCELPPDANGITKTAGENTSGAGGVNFYWFEVSGPQDESESIQFTPSLVIKERSVKCSEIGDYREVYGGGKLQRRVHFKERKVDAGTESYIEKEERFPK